MCEPVPERAAENRARWQVPVYTDWLELLEEERPDVVLLATPPDAYHALACAAAERGAHIITEIPLGPTGPIARMMQRAAEERGVKLEVAENVYRWASERLKQKIIAAGVLGRPKHARLWYTSGCYHGFNAVRMLLGAEPRRVLGYTGTIQAPWDVDYLGQTLPEQTWEAALIEFGNGAACLYEMPPPGPRGNFWEVEGTEAALLGNELVLDGRHYPFQWEYTTVEGEQALEHVRVDTDPPIVWENPFKEFKVQDNDEVARVQILVDFHRAVTEGQEVAYPPARAWPDQELWIALRESALRGNVWVELPLQEVTSFEQRLQDEYRVLYGCAWDDLESLRRVAFPRGGVRWTVGRQL
jgi:predicted dehydrogenase